MTRVCFSGRTDRPHCGHIATIVKLSKMFDDVHVPVLEYDGQKYPVQYRVEVLSACVPENVKVFPNTTHFKDMTRSEWDRYGCDVYAGANPEVNEHMISLGVPVLWMPRSFHYAASHEEWNYE
jgi:glycerol-3-phosphate cytidylyltransferase-like family protein